MEIRSKILQDLALLLDEQRTAIIEANKKEIASEKHEDSDIMVRQNVDDTNVSRMMQ